MLSALGRGGVGRQRHAAAFIFSSHGVDNHRGCDTKQSKRISAVVVGATNGVVVAAAVGRMVGDERGEVATFGWFVCGCRCLIASTLVHTLCKNEYKLCAIAHRR